MNFPKPSKTGEEAQPQMRINIKTPTPIKDPDIRALYMLNAAVEQSSSERMKIINIQFIVDRLGYLLIPK